MRALLKTSVLSLALLLAAPAWAAETSPAAPDSSDKPSSPKKKKSTRKKRRSEMSDNSLEIPRPSSSKTRTAKTGTKKGKSKRGAKVRADAVQPAPALEHPAGSSATVQSSPSISGPAITAPQPPPEVKKTFPPPADAVPAPPPTVQKQKPAPTMTFEAIDVSGKTAQRQKLDIAVRLFKEQHYEDAALTSYDLMQDPKLAEFHQDANFVLAKSLYRMGMYHSSLVEFSKMLAAGAQTRFFKSSLEWLFFISHKTTNESVILGEIAKYSNADFPERFRSEFRYLLSRYHFVRGRALDLVEQKAEATKSFDEVKRLTLQIPRSDGFYPRAKYLEGLAYFRDDNSNAALESMKEVIRATRPGASQGEGHERDKEVRELAFMQLARIHYGHRQNRYAIYYYNKVERGGKQWLEALFESSWASYRIGQYEQALGNLITLSSPFFVDEYFPEAFILKAVIYYENCRYRESNGILEDFERIYLPVHDELTSMLKKEMDGAAYYNVLADIQKKNKAALKSNTDVILERILRLALTDKDLKTTNDSILELEAEIASLEHHPDRFKYSNLAKSLLEELKKQRETLVKKAGIMAKGKLELELSELKKLLANGLRIKFETTTKEKEFLEEQLRAGGQAEVIRKYKYSVAVGDDQLYWPYEGEYWRDELGTYQYTLTKGCVEKNANRLQPQATRSGD